MSGIIDKILQFLRIKRKIPIPVTIGTFEEIAETDDGLHIKFKITPKGAKFLKKIEFLKKLEERSSTPILDAIQKSKEAKCQESTK